MTPPTDAFECIICYNEYDTKQRRPCIGQCGHSICESCKHQLTTAKCPQCNREEAFSLTTINYQVLELMKTIGRTSVSSTESPSRISRIKNNLEEGLCSECGVLSKRLRICINCGINDKILIQRDKGVLSLNLEGTSVEEAVNRAKQRTIYGDCALETHDEHDTMKFADLKKDLDDIQHNSFETRITEMQKLTKTNMEDFKNQFDSAYDATKDLLNLSTTLTPSDRKPHYSNIELSLHNMSIINDTILDTMQRLQLEEGLCSECGVLSKRLRICINCGINDKILIQRDKGVLSLNLEGTSVDEAVNRAKQRTICGDCALENHDDHDTMKFADLKKDLDDLRAQLALGTHGEHDNIKLRDLDGTINDKLHSALVSRRYELNAQIDKVKSRMTQSLINLTAAFRDAYVSLNELLQMANTCSNADRQPLYYNITLILRNISSVNDGALTIIQTSVNDTENDMTHRNLESRIKEMANQSEQSLETYKKIIKDAREALEKSKKLLYEVHNGNATQVFSCFETKLREISSINRDMSNAIGRLKANTIDIKRQIEYIKATGTLLRNSSNPLHSTPLIEDDVDIDNNLNE